MKMKAVIAQTGLTDRAVRLYMEQGLISPSCTEKYNGRKNIDFTPQDVTCLQNIALLRRAGFSIAEIRRMQQNVADVPLVLREFIERERTLVQRKDSILHALDTLPLSDGTTTEDICRCIDRAVHSGEIPREDLYPLPGEKKNQRNFFRFGVFLVILGAAVLAVLPIMWHSFYRYFYVSDGGWSTAFWEYHGWLVLGVVGVLYMLFNRRKSRITRRRKRVCDIGVLLSIAYILLTSFSTLLSFGLTQPFFASRTTNPSYYRAPDKRVRELISDWFPDNLFDVVFPARIPDSARYADDELHTNTASFPASTQYYYYYNDCIDASFDITAQWSLSPQEYAQAKAAVPDSTQPSIKRGEWTCVYYADSEPDNWQNARYTILIFACNDRTHTVRYIASFNEQMIYPEGPYYTQLDW